MTMNLIDIYVSEIGRQLPKKNRADIEAEIRSALQDILDERSQQAGKPINDELILEVLQEYGSPEKVAASYQGERSLIGPRLYPSFIKVIQIVLPIMGVLSLIGLGLSLGRPESTAGIELETAFQVNVKFIINTISRAINGFFGSMISALGCITLIFAILERLAPDLKTKETHWDAHSLLRISQTDRIKPTELIVEIIFAWLAILIFGFFPQILGFTPSLNSVVESGNWQTVTFTSFLSEAFLQYVPFLTAIWVLIIVLNGILLQRGHWEVWSRWCAVGIKTLGILIAVFMLTGPSLIADTVFFPTTQGADILMTMLNSGVRTALALSILLGGLDLIKMLLRLFRSKTYLVLETK
jgi:hypothetical protein